MPIPTYEGRRTYFFFAAVEPKELMTFGVAAGIQFDDDSTLEVLGHALAYWAIAEEQEVLTLRAFVQDVFDVTLAIYALIRLDRGDRREALRLRAELHSWLEVRVVEARAPLPCGQGLGDGDETRLAATSRRARDERGATSTAHGRRDVDSPRRHEERRSRRRSREPRRDPRARRRRPQGTRSERGRELVVGARPDVG
jgi:hypothetical protein